MDPQAWRIREVVVDACAAIDAVESGRQPGDTLLAALCHLRLDLLALAADTCDCEAADDACGVVEQIDAALSRVADLLIDREAV
ncbi:MAG: hypothetical protein M3N52_11020 [Actinomycetota bacterium]|nr:hypothetical protein [Actinomycetota bacterium]